MACNKKRAHTQRHIGNQFCQCSISKTILTTNIVWAKSPGITGTSTNLPVTLFNSYHWGSQQRHCTVSICSKFTACIKNSAFKKVFKSRTCHSFQRRNLSSKPLWKPLGTFKFMKWIFQLSPGACWIKVWSELHWREALSLKLLHAVKVLSSR